jgi:hypothetical protein
VRDLSHADVGIGQHRLRGLDVLDRIAPISHYGFYILVLAMTGTGYTTAILAGLPAIVFGGSGAPLSPTLMIYPTRVAHFYIATLLVGFISLHVAAAFYHHFVRKDRLFRRMFFGRRTPNPSVSELPVVNPHPPSPAGWVPPLPRCRRGR